MGTAKSWSGTAKKPSELERTCGRRSFLGNEMAIRLLPCLCSKLILKINQADIPKGSEAGCSSVPFSLNTSFLREFVTGNAKQYMPVFWAIRREVMPCEANNN